MVHAASFHDRDFAVMVSIWPASDTREKAGAIHIDLLQAILLMEADFNVMMKLLIGHCMVCNTILARAIPQECFGSWLERMAIQVSLNWCLIVDVVSCQQHTTLVVTLVDCLTCYDSVVHGPASLACQCLGAPPSILCMIFQMIQLMKFFL